VDPNEFCPGGLAFYDPLTETCIAVDGQTGAVRELIALSTAAKPVVTQTLNEPDPAASRAKRGYKKRAKPAPGSPMKKADKGKRTTTVKNAAVADP